MVIRFRDAAYRWGATWACMNLRVERPAGIERITEYLALLKERLGPAYFSSSNPEMTIREGVL